MAKLKKEFHSMCNGLFHQNCECTCNICRPLGEATCVANTTIVFGVKNMCDLILCLEEKTNEFHKARLCSRWLFLMWYFNINNSTFMNLTPILKKQFHGINLKNFGWGDQMMAKIGMLYALYTNKPCLHETLNDEFFYTNFFCHEQISLKPSHP